MPLELLRTCHSDRAGTVPKVEMTMTIHLRSEGRLNTSCELSTGPQFWLFLFSNCRTVQYVLLYFFRRASQQRLTCLITIT
jgi:hypothetical protein